MAAGTVRPIPEGNVAAPRRISRGVKGAATAICDAFLMNFRNALVAAGFAGFRATRLHRLARPATQGLGVILALHRVRAFAGGFAPNRGLEITPAFLETALGIIAREGFEFVTLDEARRRLLKDDRRRFAALTFDDGYQDTLEVALPILERRQAPFAVYCAPGFVERRARLWWLELEEAIRRLDAIVVAGRRFSTRTLAEKETAFTRVYWRLRGLPEDALLTKIADLAEQAHVRSDALYDRLFMGWDDLRGLARHPLATIGAHGMTHRRLAHCAETVARSEMVESRATLAAELGVEVRHFAYPVGDGSSAGPREFAIARDLDFATAVTTRPGMIFDAHARRLTALPRLSINGGWQSEGALEILLSGAPFWLWNRGRLALNPCA